MGESCIEIWKFNDSFPVNKGSTDFPNENKISRN